MDPIIGLLPGIGDAVGAGLSLYIVYEAARLGAPARVLGRMLVNIAVETAVGALPLVGDIFDFAWQANTRNLALLDQLLSPEWRPRPLGRVLVASVIAGAALVTGLLACAWWVFHALVRFTPFAGR